MTQFSDSQLDDQLRRVPVPSGLRARLKGLSHWEGEMLDDDLSDVAVPARIKDRLKRIPADESLERVLARVETPADLAASIKAERETNWGTSFVHRAKLVPANLARDRFTAAEVALAASLLLGLFASLTAVFNVMRLQQPYVGTQIAIEISPRAQLEESEAIATFVPVTADAVESIPEDELFNISYLDPVLAPSAGPFSDLQTTMNDEVFGESLVMIKWGPLGFPTGGDFPVEFEGPLVSREAGMAPPLVPGFDRRFLLREGFYPVVNPAADPRLQTSSAPLTQRTDSFHAAIREIRGGELPKPGDIRLEEFVAAMPLDRFLAAPEHRPVDIRVAAGPSPFSGNGAQLLQVTVMSAAAKPSRQAAHFVLAVDASQSAAWHGRWESSKKAVLDFVRNLPPRHTASVVVFQDEPYVIADRATAVDVETLAERLDGQSPAGKTNLAAAMSLSLSLAGSDGDSIRSSVILVTDDQSLANAERVGVLSGMWGDGLEQGIEISAIRVGPQPVSTDGYLLEATCQQQGVAVRNCVTEDDLERELNRLAVGGEELAQDVRLDVQFKPDAVAGYRLLGHSPTSLGGLGEGDHGSFGAGQSATVLYEVWLNDSTSDRVATVQLNWLDQEGGSQSVQQPVSRIQFAKSFRESLPSLQLAAFAAESAQYLQRSPFRAHRKFDFADIEGLERMFHPEVGKLERVKTLLSAIRTAEKLQARE